MGVASGLSLAFVPFEFRGARGWRRASPGGEVVDGMDERVNGDRTPGVLLRAPGSLVVDRQKDHPEGGRR